MQRLVSSLCYFAIHPFNEIRISVYLNSFVRLKVAICLQRNDVQTVAVCIPKVCKHQPSFIDRISTIRIV